jgi:hypothetical protein
MMPQVALLVWAVMVIIGLGLVIAPMTGLLAMCLHWVLLVGLLSHIHIIK